MSERGIAGAVGGEHMCLAVEDVDQAVAFYRSAFGYQPVFEARGMTDLMRGIVGVPERSSTWCSYARRSQGTCWS